MIKGLYEVWKIIVGINAAIAIISILIVIYQCINADWAKKRTVKLLRYIFVIAVGTVTLFSCIIGLMFTEVPRVYGESVNEAECKLKEANLTIAFQPGINYENNWDSKVIGQSIDEKSIVKKGTKVVVFLAEAYDEIDDTDGKIVVPQLVGMEQEEATTLLTDLGLQFQVWWTAENNKVVDKYYVIDQSIPEESSVRVGTLVKLELSPNAP